MRPTSSEHIRPIDQAVLDLLRQHRGMTVQDFTDCLEVTATAVRQRLDRLVEVELIERKKECIGRGRPQFRYFLTPLGARYSSVSYVDLALALWSEVIELPNPSLRSRILHRVARRMSRDLIASAPAGADLEEKMNVMIGEFAKRKIPASVDSRGATPVLNVLACPFPDLALDGRDRQVCEMELEMISSALGQPVALECCRLDGHEHCQFRPATESEVSVKSRLDLPVTETK
jgi:predicted ArsR family transcriptional regulator